ncbi:MAG: NusG domain II-containing protein [Clostridiales bacterium]|nr:NusG domain II-containing protein [Clostridiales bacterium]
MDKTARLSFRRGDLVSVGLILILIVLCAALFFPRGENAASEVQVYLDGKLVYAYPLYEDRTITLTGVYTNEIEIKDASVRILKSDCPGEDCVHTGWISSAGRSIVCLPNRAEIRITGQPDVDFVVR